MDGCKNEDSMAGSPNCVEQLDKPMDGLIAIDFAPDVKVELLNMMKIIELRQEDVNCKQDVIVGNTPLKQGQITFVSQPYQSTTLSDGLELKIITMGDARYLSLPKLSEPLAIVIPSSNETHVADVPEQSPIPPSQSVKPVKPRSDKRPPLSIILPRLVKKAAKSRNKSMNVQKVNDLKKKAEPVDGPDEPSVSNQESDQPIVIEESAKLENISVDRPYRCEQCTKSFITKHTLKTHRTIVHKEKFYHCEIENCAQTFMFRKELLKHEKTHPEDARFVCKTCGQQVTGKTDFKAHTFTHVPGEYLCDQCPKMFKNKSSLRKHLQNHEKDVTKILAGGKVQRVNKTQVDLTCTVCSKKFSGHHAMVNHQRGVHGMKIARGNTYSCEHCGLGYDTTKGLRDHIMSNHTEGKHFVCNVCEKGFSKKELFKQHLRMHTGERPYSCQVCGNTFRLYTSYYKHKKIHTGEKPYECEFCSKRFASRSYLNVHLRLHTGNNPFQCEFCEKNYPQKVQLKLHTKSHHPDHVIDF